MPAKGENLVVVGEYENSLQFRVFDEAGKCVVDHSEPHRPRLMAFKQELARLHPPHELTLSEKALISSPRGRDLRQRLPGDHPGRHQEGADPARAKILAESERLERPASGRSSSARATIPQVSVAIHPVTGIPAECRSRIPPGSAPRWIYCWRGHSGAGRCRDAESGDLEIRLATRIRSVTG